MARTINRQPASVGYPSKNDMKDYFFNHYNWKGINDDKNFLEVDQETFQEAENVYVDSEGLLRSRPALKNKNVVLKDASDNDVTIDTVSDFRVFGDIYVYVSDNDVDEKTYMYFSNKNTGALYYIDDSHVYTFAYNYVDNKPIDYKIILSRRKIFIFTESSFDYFDMDDYTFGSATNFIYVPTTKRITTNTTEDLEAPNPLTNKEIYAYLYSNVIGVNSDVYNKTVTVEINGQKYTTVFTENTPYVLSRVYSTIASGYNKNVTINMAVSKDNVCAIYNESTRTMSMSFDGLTFQSYSLPDTAGTVKCPVKFSKDGSLVYIVTTTGIWWLSVYANNSTGVKDYPVFTNVSSIYPTFAPEINGNNAFGYFIFAIEILEDCNLIMLFGDSVQGENCTHYIPCEFDGTNINDDVEAMSLFPVNARVHNYCRDTVYCSESYTIDYNGNTYNIDRSLIVMLDGYASVFAHSTDTTEFYCIFAPFGDLGESYRCAVKDINGDIFVVSHTKNIVDEIMLHKYKINFTKISALALTSKVTNKNYATAIADEISLYAYTFPYSFASSVVPTRPLSILDDGSVAVTPGVVNFTSSSITLWLNGVTVYGEKGVYIIASTQYTYYFVTLNDQTNSTTVYVTNIDNPVTLTCEVVTKYDDNSQPINYNYILPEHNAELHNFYLSIGNKVYISEDAFNNNKQWLWYLPQQQQFNYRITGLHPISDSVMGVFMENEVDYIAYDSEKAVYLYQKSKLQLGLPDGNNIITSFDGTTVLFVTKRGLVAMGYQDFIASTEQALSYLSDGIYQLFDDWNKTSIRLMLHGFWLICYKPGGTDCYIYDIRTKSWWHCEYINDITTKFIEDENKLYYLGESELYTLSTDDTEYYDTLGDNKYPIDWRISSQKLYLNAVNYYKHIVNITFNIALHNAMTTQGKEVPQDYTMNLDVCNYRKERNIVSTENFGYKIDMIRTCIKRVNYAKVCEFQYRLSADLYKTVEIQVPLSLADITIKYKIAGQVR